MSPSWVVNSVRRTGELRALSEIEYLSLPLKNFTFPVFGACGQDLVILVPIDIYH